MIHYHDCVLGRNPDIVPDHLIGYDDGVARRWDLVTCEICLKQLSFAELVSINNEESMKRILKVWHDCEQFVFDLEPITDEDILELNRWRSNERQSE